MKSSVHRQLLEDVLHSPALEASLSSARRAARGRRHRRLAARAGTIIAVIWVSIVLLPPRARNMATHTLSPAPQPSAETPAGRATSHAVVTTSESPAPVIVRTRNAEGPTMPPTDRRPPVHLVSTVPVAPAFERVSDDDLLAAAGTRPVALQRLPDGSARWFWLAEQSR
jgi:hypothetical protein